jgi:ribosomal protein S18 acetylase RimI-like enzyme
LKKSNLSLTAQAKNLGWLWHLSDLPVLELKRQHTQLYDLIFLDPLLAETHAQELSFALTEFLLHEKAELRVLEPPAPTQWREFLLKTGLISYQKILYSRPLDADIELNSDLFQLESLAKIGESVFIDELERVFQGDSETLSWPAKNWNAKAEFEQLKTHAAEAFAPQNWFRVSLETVPVGILLPQVYPDNPSEGTLFYIGVFPEQRGRGYGRALHHLGLKLLSQRGVRRYLGSTDIQNQAMQKIFAHNSCKQTRLLTFFNT